MIYTMRSAYKNKRHPALVAGSGVYGAQPAVIPQQVRDDVFRKYCI